MASKTHIIDQTRIYVIARPDVHGQTKNCVGCLDVCCPGVCYFHSDY